MSDQAVTNLNDWEARHHNPRIQSILEELKASPDEGPGRFLCAMREALEFSDAEVASRLSIGVQQLQALETDDYDNLPAPIFVRNFLRRYADFLEIPLEAVLVAYDARFEVEAPELARVSLREKLNSRSMSMRWATWTALALFVVLMVIWWQGRDVQKVDTGLEVPAQATPSSGAMEIPLEIDVAPADSSENE